MFRENLLCIFILLYRPVCCLNFSGIDISSLRLFFCFPETCIIRPHGLPADSPLFECNCKIVSPGVDIHTRIGNKVLRFYSITSQFVKVLGVHLHKSGAKARNRIVTFNVCAEVRFILGDCPKQIWIYMIISARHIKTICISILSGYQE